MTTQVKSDLVAWIEESRKQIPSEMNERFNRGHWIGAYRIVDGVSGYSLRQLRSRLELISDGGNTFFPTHDYTSHAKENVEKGCVEFSPQNERCYAYWYVTPEGEAFAIHGHGEHEVVEGQTLSEKNVAKKVRELLEHAFRLADELECSDAIIQVRTEWHGLKGKRMPLFNCELSDPAHWDSAEGKEATVSDIRERTAHHVHLLTTGMYHAFGQRYDVKEIEGFLDS